MSNTALSFNGASLALTNPVPMLMQTSANSSNMVAVASVIAPATPAVVQLKATFGRLYLLDIGNSGTTDVWVKIWAALGASVTLGTTNATTNIYVPKGTRQVHQMADIGDFMTIGISYAVTGGIALNDNTAITAATVSVNIRYS